MRITIVLTKDDINTSKLGSHYEIKTESGLVINFTSDALDEFLADIQTIKKEELKKPEFPPDRDNKGREIIT